MTFININIEQIDNAGPHPQKEEGDGNREQLVLQDIHCLPKPIFGNKIFSSVKLEESINVSAGSVY